MKENFPNSYRTYIVLGNFFSIFRKPNNAIKFFEKSTKKNPNNAYGYYLLANEFITCRKFLLAKGVLLQSIIENKFSFILNYGLGIFYLNTNKYDKALNYFLKANYLSNKNSNVLFHISKCYRNMNQYKKALGYLTEAEACCFEENDYIHYYKSYCFYKIKNMKKAKDFLDQIINPAITNSEEYELLDKNIIQFFSDNNYKIKITNN